MAKMSWRVCAVVAENGGRGVLNGFARAAPKGVVDSPHQFRLIESVYVLAQKVAQGYGRPAYFLSVSCHVGKNYA